MKVGDIYLCNCSDHKHIIRLIRISEKHRILTCDIDGDETIDDPAILGKFICNKSKNKNKYIALMFKYPKLFK